MESSVYLEGPFNTLHQAKRDCHSQNQDSNPKSVPLHAISPVIPPLRQCSRVGLIKDLLQNNKTIVPKRKIFHLAVACAQIATFYDPRIELGRRGNLLKPFSGGCV